MHPCADTPPHVHLSHAWSWAGRQGHPNLARLGVGFLGLIASPVLAIDLATLPLRRAACCRSSAQRGEGAGGPAAATRLAQRSVERTPSTHIDETDLASLRVIGSGASGPAVQAPPPRERPAERKGMPRTEPSEQKLRAGVRLQVPSLEAFKTYRRRLFDAREAAVRHRAAVDAALALHMPAAERNATLEALDDAVHALHGRDPRQPGFDDVRRKFPEPLRSQARSASTETREAVMAYVRARLAAVHARDRALQLAKGLKHAQALKDSLDPPGPSVR